MSTMLDMTRPYSVPPQIGRVELIVTGADDALPLAVSSYLHRAPAKTVLRLAGGCSNMQPAAKADMLHFFGSGLASFRGLVSSGATRQIASDEIDPMITEVPALLAAQAPHKVISVSTVPRTDRLGLVDDSRLVLSQDGQLLPNPGVHMIIVVQQNNGNVSDWDGDLDKYFSLFQSLVGDGLWRAGMIVYNGGGVTRTEAVRAMALGWPVVLVRGSGRMADQLITEFETGELELPGGAPLHRDRVATVDNGDAAGLAEALTSHGLIAA